MDRNAGLLIKLLFFIAISAAAIFFLISIGNLVKLIVIAALLAYITDPLAVFLESRGMSRMWAAVVIFSCGVLLVALCLTFFLPALSSELISMREGFNQGRVALAIAKLQDAMEQRLSFLGIGHPDLVNKLRDAMASAGDWLFSHMLDMVSLITDLVIVPFIAFFLLKDGREFKKQLISLVPNRYFELSLNILYKMDLQLGNYLRGQFLDAVIFGVMSTISLLLLNVKYSFAIGILAGLANLIPFLGPIAGGSAAVLVSITDTGSLMPALHVLVVFAALKLIDDSLIQPLVVARSVHMHPLMVLLAVIIGGKLAGILGMVLAVPVAGFLKIVLREGVMNYRKYHLADT